LCVLKFEQEVSLPQSEQTISAVISDIHQKFPKVHKKIFSKTESKQKANLHMPNEYKQCYVDILYKHQEAISVNKFDLG
jgi:hypothetical protein